MENGLIKWGTKGTEDGKGKIIMQNILTKDNINIKPCEYEEFCRQNDTNKYSLLFEIESIHALTQLIDYAKFALRNNGVVYFRGQTNYYNSLKPSLLRDVNSINAVNKRLGILTTYINNLVKKRVFESAAEYFAYEPLLQHYGIKTPWIDLVDNIWIALWFACYKAQAVGAFGKYLHFEKSSNEYSYIHLVNFGCSTNQLSASIQKRVRAIKDI